MKSQANKTILKKCSGWTMRTTGIFAALLLAGGARAESSDPLLNALIKKGILTEDEAKSIKADADASQTNMPVMESSKWKINTGIKSIELFGDLRVRYEDREAHDPQGGKIALDRFRYAVRVGVRGEAFDDFYYGVRLETSANPRSPWVTFGTSSSSSPYQGPFGKGNAGLNVGQIYLGWRGLNWFDLTVGKMPNPLYTTSMVWDSDYLPEGVAERFKYTVGEADLFATFGQFIYQDVNPVSASPGFFNITYTSANPAFLLAWQAGVNYHITKKLSFKVAPVFYNYTTHGEDSAVGTLTPDFNGTFIGQGSSAGVNGVPASFSGFPNGQFDGFAANQTGINDLSIIEIPWELNYHMENHDIRLFGDYAQNLDGSARATAAFNALNSPLLANSFITPIPSPQTDDNHAYQVGLAVGNKDSLGMVYNTTSRKHGWEARAFWQHVEQYALDPNLLDSDFFEGRANMEGLYAAFAYGFTDNIIGTVRYGYAHRINDKLGTGGSNQDVPQINAIHEYNLLQFDLALRF
jgi:hypothetical protein